MRKLTDLLMTHVRPSIVMRKSLMVCLSGNKYIGQIQQQPVIESGADVPERLDHAADRNSAQGIP